MDDPIEDLSLLLVIEDDIADCFAIELHPVVLQDPLAKVVDDCLISCSPWLNHRSSEIVGIDDGQAMRVV